MPGRRLALTLRSVVLRFALWLGGIELTTVELDGAGLVAAAERSTGYRSDAAPG